MRCGLYGKLPARRDFVATGVPREVLQVWEAWLQAGLSASRMQLGAAWQDAFLRAPIWRFWLGRDLCGAAVTGAFMPSVDGVGRYFPLTVLAFGDGAEALPPPELDRHEAWFAAAEDLLLSALAEGATYEALSASLPSLPRPDPAPPPADAPRRLSRSGALLSDGAAAPLDAILAGFRRADHARVYGAMTYWWTQGGDDLAPHVLSSRGMPDAYLFTGMLTGRFDDISA